MAQFTFTLQELESIEGRENLLKWFQDYDLKDYLTDAEIAVIRNRNTWTEEKLARMILNHYYIREIGLETPALFKLKLSTALKEIMEEKAPLIYSMSFEISPLNEFEIETNTMSNNLGSRDSNGSGLNIMSRTPQGQINKSAILNGTYASNTEANENESYENTQDSGETNQISKGHNKSQMQLIREYRSNILMVNREIIDDLADLFIGIY